MSLSFAFGALNTTISGHIRVGDKAPGFKATDSQAGWTLNYEFQPGDGKVYILNAVPSLDTPVCDTETRRFNQEAAALPGVEILTISMDLPAAQKRWCGAAGIDKVKVLSDFNTAAFGQAYGTLLADVRVLARASFVVDGQGTVVYAEYLPAAKLEPDYAAIIAAAKAAAR